MVAIEISICNIDKDNDTARFSIIVPLVWFEHEAIEVAVVGRRELEGQRRQSAWHSPKLL
ncbi:MAG TPA: hypothetical protein VLI54_03160 [Bacillota bacterium]|nr:hypothetical protein [Bacillota bacterium]